MRRQDIRKGVEYAKTAPLAYGQTPRVSPSKVRFIDPNAGSDMVWLIDAEWTDRDGWTATHYDFISYDAARKLGVTATSLRDQEHDKPARYLSIKPASKAGRSPLAAERWSDHHQRWFPTWVAPAEVHSTWAEVEQQRQEHAAKQRERQIEAGFPEVEKLLEDLGLTDILKVVFRGKKATIAAQSVDGLPEALRTWAIEKGLISA